MSNCSIEFVAKNNLIAGVTAGDTVYIAASLTAFDMTTRTEKVTNKTKDGSVSSSVFYVEDSYKMEMLAEGTFVFTNLAETPLTTAIIEMFLRSVNNSETFSITDLDNSDNIVIVQLISDWSRTRQSSADVDRFDYSFTVRKV